MIKNDTMTENAIISSPSFWPRLRQRVQRMPQRLFISVVLFVVALGVNLYHLGNPSIWFDEAFSVELARQPLPLLWHIIFGPEPNMELYYLFLHFWLGFTGLLGLHATEFVVRFPSAVFAAFSTVAVFLFGRRFIGTIAGIVGAGLYLLNFLQLVYAQQTRAYSLQLLLLCVAWYALVAALTCTSQSRRWWICYVVASTLAVYTHLFSLLVFLAQWIAVAGILSIPNSWREQARKRLLAAGSSLLATCILIIPMLWESRQGAKTGWLPVPHLSDLWRFFLNASGYSKFYLLAIIACCGLGLLVIVLLPLAKSGRGATLRAPDWLIAMGNRGTREVGAREVAPLPDALVKVEQNFIPLAWMLLCWLFIPLIVSYIVSQGSLRLFSSRYLVVVIPPLCLLIGLALAVWRRRTIQVLLAVVLLVLAVSVVPLYYRSAQVENWNEAAHWLQQKYQVGDGLVCYDNDVQQGCQVSIEYYLHAYPGSAHFTDDTPGAFSWANFGPAHAASGTDAAVDPSVLQTFAAHHGRIFYIVGRLPNSVAAAKEQSARQWLDSHYHRVAQIVTPTVTVYLYATGGGAG